MVKFPLGLGKPKGTLKYIKRGPNGYLPFLAIPFHSLDLIFMSGLDQRDQRELVSWTTCNLSRFSSTLSGCDPRSAQHPEKDSKALFKCFERREYIECVNRSFRKASKYGYAAGLRIQ